MRYINKIFWLLSLFLVSCIFGTEISSASKNNQTPSTIIFHSETKKEKVFFIEIADTQEKHAQGLMYRTSLPLNQGMLFIFREEHPLSFWMKNTFISLDIIYMNRNFEVITIMKRTVPKSETPLSSVFPAKFALEINAGLSDQYHIVPGDKALLN